MQFVQNESSATVEIKKSKFIAYISSYNEFKSIMVRLKEMHPKARHFVYAYRYLNEFEQVVENSSDDGEPKGTSGRPALSVLSGSEMINTAVIIVRYFGGIRLGTGGLVKAYSDAVNNVLQIAQKIPYVKLKLQKLTIEYKELSQVEYLLQKYNIHIEEKIFTQQVTLYLEGSQEDFIKFSQSLSHENILEERE